MKVCIIKYNAGNVKSVSNALLRLGVHAEVSDDPDTIKRADRVIFPGVGEASTAMNYLKSKSLDQLIVSLKQPFLGICLGLQLMCKHSQENDTTCLGIFDLEVVRFGKSMKVPHMGWNIVEDLRGPLLSDLPERPYLYFVHSYFAQLGEDTIATANYSSKFSVALQKDNFFAVQAHPEKSGETGSRILENFLKLEI
ncbi:MAG: imidazole glycerol phosphate synthase subunit HisH [Cyclobacteriaceae bacterium]